MTAIVWHDGKLVLDRQVTGEFSMTSHQQKFSILGSFVYFGTGNTYACRLWCEMGSGLTDPVDTDPVPSFIRDANEKACLYRCDGFGIEQFLYDPVLDKMISAPIRGDLLGFGMAYESAIAIGMYAQEFGAGLVSENLAEAIVCITSNFSCACGGDLDVLEFDRKALHWKVSVFGNNYERRIPFPRRNA